ncbi:hypothetical protein KORDIASMS9_00313 [Kordia sp. SMS9]|uniref:hypothetical protein n=1 Tax=Kordia sp. SMS9 TaxID=2282170 RepID=UPI000E0D37CC|nr:hypothetical protein [Kordia sp. SMS9]AXG68123.1 hypothetical protein KORDIASMS9_00313 [Kordia sp. SMS9]
MSEFKIPKENWKSISIDSALFILNESKDYIDYTLKESESITSRSYSLVLVLVTLLSAIIGYTYSKVVEGELSNIIYINFFFIFTIVMLVIYLSIIIFPKKMIVKGRMPKELALKNVLITPKLTDKQNYLAFIIQEIENSQHKIDFNLRKNALRRSKLKMTMYTIIVLMPIYLIIAFFTI